MVGWCFWCAEKEQLVEIEKMVDLAYSRDNEAQVRSLTGRSQ
jgi:hypothetical protein